MLQLLGRVPHLTKRDDNLTRTAITPRVDHLRQRPTHMQIAKRNVKRMSMLNRVGYGRYFENSISNDGPLLTSGAPATNQPLAFATTKRDTFPGQDDRSIDSRNDLTRAHLLRRRTARN